MDERQTIIEKYVDIVRWFAARHLPKWLLTMAGGVQEVVGDLYPAYIKAIDKWLASDRKLKVTTYVAKAMKWRSYRLANDYAIIRVPETAGNASYTTKLLHRRMRRVLSNVRVRRFGGREGRCNHTALLTRDTDTMMQMETRKLIQEVLTTLSYRERDLIGMRYGLNDCNYGRTSTLAQVAHEFQLTVERIRQIELRAMRKLRSEPRSSRLLLLLNNHD